ncbi:glycosyltransferase family 39 protein [Thermochromatium tepidum]|uniref:glycosyltransferase family 39 protein n=1 Tax=Thermochromatium tepidum TaxID=1050 RepID=UPI0013896C60|nr:glycosyltransferase family 39 protein [Thermochromatium tepidum]
MSVHSIEYSPPAASRARLWSIAALALWSILSRFWGLDHLLVWHDEVFTLIRVLGYSHDELQSVLFSGQILTPSEVLRFQTPTPEHGWRAAFAAFVGHPEHAPLYYGLGVLVVGLPLDPVTALRGLSALFGLLLIPAVSWLTRELFGPGPTPWVAAALVACSPLQLLYAQEARQYALWLLLLVLSCLTLAIALRRGSWGAWLVHALTTALGLYAHLLFLPMIAVQAFWVLLVLFLDGEDRRYGLEQARRWAISLGLAVLAFSPWLWLVFSQHERVGDLTAWMRRPIGWPEILAAWGRHLVETFVDPSPGFDRGWLWLLLPLGWALWFFIRAAPRPGAWLILSMALAYVGLVLGPDLLLGGSRSQHARYVLPTLLAVQLMMAWWIGSALGCASGSMRHRLGLSTLTLLLALGLFSQILIARAETWSTKHLSAHTREVARLVNAGERPLVLASASSVGLGELIALAYHLEPHVRLWGQPRQGESTWPSGYEPIFLLTPTEPLRRALSQEALIRPLAGTWQWFIVTRQAKSQTRPSPPD